MEPSLDRADTMPFVFIVGYLALHMIWLQRVQGPYTFLVLRTVFLLVFAAYLVARHRTKALRTLFIGKWFPPLKGWGLAAAILASIGVARTAMDFLFHFTIEPFAVRYFVESCLLAPLNEEIVFRGIFLGTFLTALPRRPFAAVVLSAVIFAGCHDLSDGRPLLPLLLLGGLCGWAYTSFRSVPFCILCHLLWNAGSYVPFIHDTQVMR